MENTPRAKLEKTALLKEDAFKKVQHMFKPVGVENKDENGGLVIENEAIKIALKYEELKFSIYPTPRTEEAFIDTQLGVNERALIKFLDFRPEEYFLLKSYIIENKINGLVINLKDELGENSVYVKKNGNDPSQSAAHYLNTFVKVNIEPTSSAGILTMFHEIGHKKDHSIDPIEIALVELGKKKDKEILDKEMINRERYAWAYSLSKLRAYLKGLGVSGEDLDVFVHKWALGTYSVSTFQNDLVAVLRKLFI